MIQNLLLVGCGSFVGGALRYFIGQMLAGRMLLGFGMGTISVNLAGCFIFGIIYGLLERLGALQTGWALLLTVGLCGGFTTFSTFGNEMLTLMRTGEVMVFASYTLISVMGGIFLVLAVVQLVARGPSVVSVAVAVVIAASAVYFVAQGIGTLVVQRRERSQGPDVGER